MLSCSSSLDDPELHRLQIRTVVWYVNETRNVGSSCHGLFFLSRCIVPLSAWSKPIVRDWPKYIPRLVVGQFSWYCAKTAFQTVAASRTGIDGRIILKCSWKTLSGDCGSDSFISMDIGDINWIEGSVSRGRCRYRLEDIIRIGLQKCRLRVVDWIYVVQEWGQWLAVVNTGMNSRIP